MSSESITLPSVLILIDTRIIGGPGRGLFHFLDSADPSRFNYVLCSFRYTKAGSQQFLEEAKNRNYNVVEIHQKTPFDISPLMQLSAIITSQKISILQSHGYKSHLIAALLKTRHAVKWISFSHGWTTENLKVRLYDCLDCISLRFADLCVAVSKKLQEDLTRYAWLKNDPIAVLNAINLKTLPTASGGKEIREKLEIPHKATVFGCFGRLSSEKGQLLLIGALARLKKEHCYIIFVGDGPDREVLVQAAERIGKKENVRFVGYQSETAPYYDAIDCLVIPSLSEGLPNVLLEAMAYRKNIVSTPVGAVPDVIRNQQSGFLADTVSINGIHDALERYLTSDPEFLNNMKQEAYQIVMTEFDSTARADRILDLYDSLIE